MTSGIPTVTPVHVNLTESARRADLPHMKKVGER